MGGHLHIYGPQPTAFPSGGNRYNQQLARSLSRLGLAVSLGPVIPDVATGLLVDTLFMNRSRPALPAWLLVHYLPGMEHNNVRAIPASGQWQGAVVTGDVTHSLLRSAGWSAGKIRLLYPGIPSFSQPVRRDFSEMRIAWVGNWLPNKGILPLLQEMEKRKADLRMVPVRLRLAGSAEMDTQYAAACRDTLARIPDLVDYLGALPPDQVGDLLAASNWFVSTSTFETFGMALLEARANGLPILAYQGGTGVHTGPTILTFDGPQSLLAGILQLANHPEERQNREERARCEAGKLSEQFPDWMLQAKKLADFIAVW